MVAAGSTEGEREPPRGALRCREGGVGQQARDRGEPSHPRGVCRVSAAQARVVSAELLRAS